MAGNPGPSVAVISGGSSGIGLALARLLAREGWHLHLIARRPDLLDQARAELLAGGAASLETHSLDVADAAACAAAIAAIGAAHGRIDWLVASAGLAEPGLFTETPLASHRRHMDVNYFGSLHLVHAGLPFLPRGSRITLVSSAAAFVGIAGYSAYGPGKFALRGLADSLRLELEGAGIAVSVACPPDTDTPQYAHENRTKPPATREITAGGGLLSADAVARSILDGARAGQFMLLPGWPIRLLGLFHSLYAPIFRWQQRRILRRHAGR
ncbi:MAG: SDR family oxidoreductase [Rhabdaerophilum sp.]